MKLLTIASLLTLWSLSSQASNFYCKEKYPNGRWDYELTANRMNEKWLGNVSLSMGGKVIGLSPVIEADKNYEPKTGFNRFNLEVNWGGSEIVIYHIFLPTQPPPGRSFEGKLQIQSHDGGDVSTLSCSHTDANF